MNTINCVYEPLADARNDSKRFGPEFSLVLFVNLTVPGNEREKETQILECLKVA
jgi:hypothetical protein